MRLFCRDRHEPPRIIYADPIPRPSLFDMAVEKYKEHYEKQIKSLERKVMAAESGRRFYIDKCRVEQEAHRKTAIEFSQYRAEHQ